MVSPGQIHRRPVRPRWHTASARGRRAVNADAVGVFARAGQNIVFALADGVGDDPGAARAARVAASSAARSPVLDGPVAAVLAAQRAVRALDGSGDCVLVVAMPFGDGTGFRIAWVGDARAYSWTGDVLTPLTSDHTLAQYFRDHDEPVTPQMEHMVTTSVRTAAAGEIGTVEGPGGGLLLTSDGVHKALHLATMRDVLARPGRTAVALVETAIALGGSDNATVILAEPPDVRPNATVTGQPQITRKQIHGISTDMNLVLGHAEIPCQTDMSHNMV